MNREPDADVLELIELYILCRTFKALPRAGGVLDQDSYTMFGLNLVAQAFEERRQKDQPRMS
jgi:hypothetical protein